MNDMPVARETVAHDWTDGISVADAPVMFDRAAAFHAALADGLDAWGRGEFVQEDLVAFAAGRRRLLHALLDRALDAAELVVESLKGCWP